jgi:putative protease
MGKADIKQGASPSTGAMELLAPVGSRAIFATAVAAGADAIYLGAPGLHARAVGREFTLAEIAAMIDHGHGHGVKVYIAANSLLKQEELPKVMETLAVLARLGPDALILQDLGLYRLIKRYFPELRLHASTLLNSHNSPAVQQFARLGFSRVVLARELTVREIARIRAACRDIELEVFVHGALCFSYSGLCLFSSALGGKSGLRGRCVQPCRRRYRFADGRDGKKKGSVGNLGGYYFSMKDLAAIRLLPDLQRAGITSLKIEGRLRSAQYVDCVVRAYRLVLDAMAAGKDDMASAMAAAEELLQQAMGRRTTTGFLTGTRPAAAVSLYHYGNIGIFLGRIDRVVGKGQAVITLKAPLASGDRLRLHRETNGERLSFTASRIEVEGRKVQQAEARAVLTIPQPFAAGDSLYKVDSRAGRELARGRSNIDPGRFAAKIEALCRRPLATTIMRDITGRDGKDHRPGRRGPQGRGGSGSLPLWLKTDTLSLVQTRSPFAVERIVVVLGRELFARFLKLKNARLEPRRIVWGLPPVIQESELGFFAQAINRLQHQGFRTFQIGHLGQLQFFPSRSNLSLIGDYTLNILNGQGLVALHDFGLQQAQVSIETDKQNLLQILNCGREAGVNIRLGMTVYGTPPLFTARLVADHFRYGRPLVSPKGERFVLDKLQGLTIALAERPFSLLHVLPELAAMGVGYGVIDLCHQKVKPADLDHLARLMAGKARGRRLATFNYEGQLL